MTNYYLFGLHQVEFITKVIKWNNFINLFFMFFLKENKKIKKMDLGKSDHLKVGEMGEKLACKYLKKKGYRIISKNYRNKFFEIDIVANKKNVLHFVEVRTKTSEIFGLPEETVNYKKKKKLIKSAKGFVGFNNYKGKYQIDLICIVLNKENKLERLSFYDNIDIC